MYNDCVRLVFSLILTLASVACAEDSTSVVLNVRSGAGATLQVRVCDQEGTRVLERSFAVSDSTARRILLTPRGQDPARRFYASLQLVDSDRLLSRRRIVGAYVPDSRVELEFSLADECASAACGQDYECTGGQCQPTLEPTFAESFPSQCAYGPTVGPDGGIALAPCAELDDPDLLVCNDFADGLGAGWSEGEESSATVMRVEDGSEQFIRANVESAGSAAYAGFGDVAVLNETEEFYVRVRVRVSSLDYNYFKPLRFLARDSRGRYEIGATVKGQRSLQSGTGPFIFFADNEGEGSTVSLPQVGQWTCLLMHVIQGNPGSVSVALDGQWAESLEVPDKPDETFESIRIGAGFVSGGVGTFEVDDFAVALRPLSCEP